MVVLSPSDAQDSASFYPGNKWRIRFLCHPRFPVDNPFKLWVCMFSLRILWYAYVFPLSRLRIGLLLHFRLCFFLPWLQCWDWGLLLSPRLVCCGFNYVLSRYGFSLGLFGHDRAKNDSGIVFLCQGCELHVLLYVCNGWSSDCVRLADFLMA